MYIHKIHDLLRLNTFRDVFSEHKDFKVLSDSPLLVSPGLNDLLLGDGYCYYKVF